MRLDCLMSFALRTKGSSIGVSIIDSKESQYFNQAINTAFFIKKVEKKNWNSLSEEQRIGSGANGRIKGDIGLPLKLDGN
ncbi:MAG: hypothetical protein R2728_09570 [Chitinophagales bacterium]